MSQTPTEGAQAPDQPTTPPEPNRGSGQFAVWDHDLGQYVSGVGDKSTASAMKKSLSDNGEHNGNALDGHKLEVREV